MQRNAKHIAIFDHIFLMGGVERVFLNYAELLIEQGYHVDLLISRTSDTMIGLIPDQVNVVRLGEGTFRHMPCRVRKYIKSNPVSAIITGNELDNFAAILANLSLAKKDRINVIISQHSIPNADDRDAGLTGRLFPLGKKLLYGKADTIIAVSCAVAESLTKIGLPKHRIKIVYNPIDIDQIHIAAQCEPSVTLPRRYIAAVGRLHRVKNLELLIKAFDLVDDPDIELVIVGEGPMGEEWKELAAKSSKNNKIHFVGTVANSAAIIGRAAVIAVPSTSESFSMTSAESIALGKTVVHTPNAGCCEILGSQHSYLADTFDDEHIFADALNLAIASPIDPNRLKSHAERFDKRHFEIPIHSLR